jgi:hypothetical protein
MKDEILIRYINKHCTATEEKEAQRKFLVGKF